MKFSLDWLRAYVEMPEDAGQVAAWLAAAGLPLDACEPWGADHILDVMQTSPEFINLSPTGDYCERPDWRPHTRYEARGERLGHQVRDLLYQRL